MTLETRLKEIEQLAENDPIKLALVAALRLAVEQQRQMSSLIPVQHLPKMMVAENAMKLATILAGKEQNEP